MTLLIVLLIAGAGTYLLRASMVLAMDRLDPGPGFEERLRLVGPAALAALVAGSLFTAGGTPTGPGLPALAAVVVGAAVARRTGNVGLALGAGLPVFWLAQAVMV